MWRPSEILVNELIREDAVTQSVIACHPEAPVRYLDPELSQTLKGASEIASGGGSGIVFPGQTENLIVHLVPYEDVISGDPAGAYPENGIPEVHGHGPSSEGAPCDWLPLKIVCQTAQEYLTVHVQFEKARQRLEGRLGSQERPLVCHAGEFADLLAMEDMLHAGRAFIPFFGQQPQGLLSLLTKSDDISSIVDLPHNRHTVLTWSLNNTFVASLFEVGAPIPPRRLRAAVMAQAAGYPVRVRLGPIVPVPNWEFYYRGTLRQIFQALRPEVVLLDVLTLNQRQFDTLTQVAARHPRLNDLLPLFAEQPSSGSGTAAKRFSFAAQQRSEMFRFIVQEIRQYLPEVPVALLGESDQVWHESGLDAGVDISPCLPSEESPGERSVADEAPPRVEITADVEVSHDIQEEGPEEFAPSEDGESGQDSAISTTSTKTPDPQPGQPGMFQDRKLYFLPLETLRPDPDQPRKFMDMAALSELQMSIAKDGVLQPVLFRTDGSGRPVIIAGERRFQAALKAGLETVPGIFIADGSAAELALIENLLRENLNPIEEAEALERLRDEKSYTLKQLAAVISKKESTISEILSLNKLPRGIKDKCRQNSRVSRRALVEVAKGSSELEMKKRFRKYEKQNLTSDQLRETSRAPRKADAILMAAIGGLQTRLKDLRLDDLAADRRAAVEEGLRQLQKLIEEQLGT